MSLPRHKEWICEFVWGVTLHLPRRSLNSVKKKLDQNRISQKQTLKLENVIRRGNWSRFSIDVTLHLKSTRIPETELLSKIGKLLIINYNLFRGGIIFTFRERLCNGKQLLWVTRCSIYINAHRLQAFHATEGNELSKITALTCSPRAEERAVLSFTRKKLPRLA